MTTLREAATQALEAMLNFPDDISDEMFESITALKAALVEDAMQKFTDVNQELQAALGCDHCNSPLYAAVKCRVCGRVTSAEPPCATRECTPSECPNCASLQDQNTELDRKLAEMEAKLNNQNVDDAFRILAEVNRRAIDYINELERQINALKRADPTQRKPLSDADLAKIWDDALDQLDPRDQLRFVARAVERAHGIEA